MFWIPVEKQISKRGDGRTERRWQKSSLQRSFPYCHVWAEGVPVREIRPVGACRPPQQWLKQEGGVQLKVPRGDLDSACLCSAALQQETCRAIQRTLAPLSAPKWAHPHVFSCQGPKGAKIQLLLCSTPHSLQKVICYLWGLQVDMTSAVARQTGAWDSH